MRHLHFKNNKYEIVMTAWNKCTVYKESKNKNISLVAELWVNFGNGEEMKISNYPKLPKYIINELKSLNNPKNKTTANIWDYQNIF